MCYTLLNNLFQDAVLDATTDAQVLKTMLAREGLMREMDFQTDTGSGMIHTDFDERLSYNKKGNHAEGDVGDHPVCRVEAKTNSGNVKVLAAGNE